MYVCVYRNIFFCIIQLGGTLQVSFDITIIPPPPPQAVYKIFNDSTVSSHGLVSQVDCNGCQHGHDHT